MLVPKKILNQINAITASLIEFGICDDQNYPNMKQYPNNIIEIGISNIGDNIFLKNVPYIDMYDEIKKNRAYNIKLLDGAMILLQYRFNNNKIQNHRLSFYPSHSLQEFQNNPDIYLDDDLYADIIDERIIPFPIRFDFDCLNNEIIEHPKSHLTLGQYKKCRIPVSSALTPYQFINFILMNFYNTFYNNKYDIKIGSYKDCFNNCIHEKERELLHFNTPIYKHGF